MWENQKLLMNKSEVRLGTEVNKVQKVGSTVNLCQIIKRQ